MELKFGKYQQEGKEILTYLADELGCPDDLERAGHVLQTVLFGLRRRLSFERAFQVFKILPFSLKTVFLLDWKAEDHAPKNLECVDDFLDEIKHYGTYLIDIRNKEQAIHSVRSVLRVIGWYVSSSQMKKLYDALPKGLRDSILTLRTNGVS